MSFLIPCPHCGKHSVYEFRFGGEVKQRPAVASTDEAWLDYTYTKVNAAGVQREWWYHRAVPDAGCAHEYAPGLPVHTTDWPALVPIH